MVDYETQYNNSVKNCLKSTYKISWKKAIAAVGHDMIHQHFRVSVGASMLAWKISEIIKDNKSK